MEEADLRELADLVVAAALKDSYAKGAYGMMVSVRPLIPELERLVPASATQLNLRLAEVDKLLDPRARALAQYDVDIRRPPDVILEKAAQAPAETRKHLYQAAVAKLFVAGEVERARAVVNENLSGEERVQMLAHLDDAEVARAVEQGKPDEARAALSRIVNSNERRAFALAKVAAAYAAKGDKERAAVLLEEARGIVGLQLANAREFYVKMNIARDYARVDPAKTFELINSLIDLAQAHERASAALRPETPYSEKRAAWVRLFNPQGEMDIPMNGSSTWGGTYMPFLKVLPELARVDFDRTRQMADRFNPNEIRLVARLIIARSVLSDRRDFVAGTPGGDIYYGQ
jgi:tetratricopeptide (TPR) repeat protein